MTIVILTLLHLAITDFCAINNFSIPISSSKLDLSKIIPSASLNISSKFCKPCLEQIFAKILIQLHPKKKKGEKKKERKKNQTMIHFGPIKLLLRMDKSNK